MNEVGLNANWLKKDLTHKETQKFAKEVLNHMRERLADYQELYGDLYNLEATPAESTMYRLAKHDVERYPNIITATDAQTPYYTNSSHLPVSFTDDVFTALDVQDELQTLYTSGTVFHAFLGEKLPTWQSAAALVRTIAQNYRLPYYTLSPTYSVCKDHGYLVGEQFTCPKCGQTTEVYSRITGYYRPVANWNAGKSQEYKERKVYDIASKLISNGKALERASEQPLPTSLVNGSMQGEVWLFVTKSCPNCKLAMGILEKNQILYRVIEAETRPDLVAQYGVRQAPTLVVTGDNNQAQLFVNASEIQRFVDALVIAG